VTALYVSAIRGAEIGLLFTSGVRIIHICRN